MWNQWLGVAYRGCEKIPNCARCLLRTLLLYFFISCFFLLGSLSFQIAYNSNGAAKTKIRPTYVLHYGRVPKKRCRIVVVD